MIKLVIQCADIHIRNYQRLEEYEEELNRFIGKCAEICAPYERDEVRIVVCGDLVQSKLVISNELMSFTSSFLRRLSEVATVLVISGNHDMLISNTARKDTMTALFETAQFENCMFLDGMLGYESGCIEDDNIVWAVYSIFDNYAKPNLENYAGTDKTVVGLYHGTIVGATLNNGRVVENGLDSDAFAGCDMVMCGDIHKRQVLKRGDVECVYSGSLIQQNFGETVTQHGFCVWDMEKKTHEFVDLPTNHGLYNIEISHIEDLDDDTETLLNL